MGLTIKDEVDALKFAEQYRDKYAIFCYNTTPRSIHKVLEEYAEPTERN